MRLSKRLPKIQNKINGGIQSDIIPSNSVSYYDFTVTDNEYALLDRANIDKSLGFSIAPSQSKDGIVLVSTTNANIPVAGWPVNDFEINILASFQSNPATGIIFDNRFVGAIDRFGITRQGGGFQFLRSQLGTTTALTTGSTTAITDVSIAEAYYFTLLQTVSGGMSLRVQSVADGFVDGVYDSTVTLTTADAKANTNPWQAYATLTERDTGSFVIDMTPKNFNLKRL